MSARWVQITSSKEDLRASADIRSTGQLHPPDEIPLETHLKAMVSDGLSSSTFREKISEFLAGLLSAHPPPLLTQLETGDVDGLSPKATAGLKKRAGCV